MSQAVLERTAITTKIGGTARIDDEGFLVWVDPPAGRKVFIPGERVPTSLHLHRGGDPIYR